MPNPLNCWEIMQCGREPGGRNALEHGVCSAASMEICHGVNQGHNGGRICWAIAGTLCGGTMQGTYAGKYGRCSQCEVFKRVRSEQGHEFQLLLPGEPLGVRNSQRKPFDCHVLVTLPQA
jgi:hypothetical protein